MLQIKLLSSLACAYVHWIQIINVHVKKCLWFDLNRGSMSTTYWSFCITSPVSNSSAPKWTVDLVTSGVKNSIFGQDSCSVFKFGVTDWRLAATWGGDWWGRQEVSAYIFLWPLVGIRPRKTNCSTEPKHLLEVCADTHQINRQINRIMLWSTSSQFGGRASNQFQELTLLFNNNNKTLFLLFSFWSTSGLK